MFRIRGIFALAVLSVVCPAVADETSEGGLPPFSYYEVILERKPFGDLAKPNAAAAPEVPDQAAIEQAKEEQALARQIDMVAVNRTPRGKIAVGFIDKGEKPPRNYYLNVGDSSGGFTVLEADFNEETATIEKDGVSIALKLGKGMIPKKTEGEEGQAASAAQEPPPPPPVQPPRPNITPRPGLVRPGLRTESGAALPRSSYMDKIRTRQANKDAQNRASAEEIAKLREEVSKAAQTSKEEAAQRERKINLELISRGQEPLSPIELTPEEDAELVRKGVFTEEAQ